MFSNVAKAPAAAVNHIINTEGFKKFTINPFEMRPKLRKPPVALIPLAFKGLSILSITSSILFTISGSSGSLLTFPFLKLKNGIIDLFLYF